MGAGTLVVVGQSERELSHSRVSAKGNFPPRHGGAERAGFDERYLR